MFDEDDDDEERPWTTRPWPLTMLGVFVLLAAAAFYLATTSPSAPDTVAASDTVADPPTSAAAAATKSGQHYPGAPAADSPGNSEPVIPSTTLEPEPIEPAPIELVPPLVPESVAAPAGDPSVCGLPPGEQTIPITPPAVDDWQLVGGQAVPYSHVFGPVTVDELGIGDCYAHSPTGAVYAAVNTVAALNLPVDRSNPLAVMDRRVAPIGDAYPMVRAQAEQDVAAASGRMPSEGASALRVALLGFTVTDYTDERAVINLAMAIGDPARVENYRQALLPVAMTWQAGDWKLVYTPAMLSPQPIVSAGQYIGWTP